MASGISLLSEPAGAKSGFQGTANPASSHSIDDPRLSVMEKHFLNLDRSGARSGSLQTVHVGKRLGVVASDPAALHALQDLAGSAEQNVDISDEYKNVSEKFPSVAALCATSKVKAPSGAIELHYDIAEHIQVVQQSLISQTARKLVDMLPTGTKHTEELCEAILHGQLVNSTFNLHLLFVPAANTTETAISNLSNVQKGILAFASCMAGFEYAYELLHPLDRHAGPTLKTVRAMFSTSVGSKACSVFEAFEGTFLPLFEQLAKDVALFLTGKPLPSLKPAWDVVKGEPIVRKFIKDFVESSGSSENKMIAKLMQQVEALAGKVTTANEKLTAANTRHDALARSTKARFGDLGVESPADTSDGKGKGKGKGRGKGDGKGATPSTPIVVEV